MDEFDRAERRFKRWIWGCTGGCLALIVAFFIVVVIVVHVLMSAAPVAPPGAFVHPEATVFIAACVRPDDPLMVDLPYHVATQPAIRRLLTSRAGEGFAFDPEQCRNIALEAAPVQLVAVLQPNPDSDGLIGGYAFAIHRGGRLMRLAVGAYQDALGEAGATVSTYRDAQLAAGTDEPVVAYFHNNFMLAHDREMAKRWIDELAAFAGVAADDDEDGGGLPEVVSIEGPLRPVLGRVDRSQPILFAATNANGELAALLRRVCPDPRVREKVSDAGLVSDSIFSIAAQLRPLNAVSALITTRIECATASDAESLVSRLDVLFGQIPDGTPLRRITVNARETVVTVNAELLNAPETLAQFAGRLVAHARRSAREAATPPSP